MQRRWRRGGHQLHALAACRCQVLLVSLTSVLTELPQVDKGGFDALQDV